MHQNPCSVMIQNKMIRPYFGILCRKQTLGVCSGTKEDKSGKNVGLR